MYNACALCGSSDLIRNVRVHDDGTGWGYSAREHYVTIERKPQAVLFNDAVSSKLLATICGSCGYTVFFVDNPHELYSAYQQAQQQNP